MERQAKDGTFYKKVGADEWAPITRTAKDGTVYRKVGTDSWQPETAKEKVQEVEKEESSWNASDLITGRASQGLKEKVGRAVIDGLEAAAPYLTTKTLIEKIAPSTAERRPVMSDKMREYVGEDIIRLNGVPDDYSVSEMISGPLDLVAAEGAGKVVRGVSRLVSSAGRAVAPKLAKTAEGLAVRATEATGAQSSKFADDAGRQLLDRKLVRAGDTSEKIGERVAKAHSESQRGLDDALSALESRGVEIDMANIAEALEARIQKLSMTPGNEKVVKQLQNELDGIYLRNQAELPIAQGEKAKRNFQSQTNYASPESEKKATAHVAREFRKEVERAATAADPKIGKRFIEEKKTFGLLDPIKEAAEKRALTNNQKSPVTMKDIAAFAIGDLPGLVANKVVTPRIASTAAVATDGLSKYLARSPNLKKLSAVRPAAIQAIIHTSEKTGTGVMKAADERYSKAEPKGETKWALDGMGKLSEQVDPEILEKAAKSKEGRALLMRAADHKPGSEKMNAIVSKINSKFGGEK